MKCRGAPTGQALEHEGSSIALASALPGHAWGGGIPADSTTSKPNDPCGSSRGAHNGRLLRKRPGWKSSSWP